MWIKDILTGKRLNCQIISTLACWIDFTCHSWEAVSLFLNIHNWHRSWGSAVLSQFIKLRREVSPFLHYIPAIRSQCCQEARDVKVTVNKMMLAKRIKCVLFVCENKKKKKLWYSSLQELRPQYACVATQQHHCVATFQSSCSIKTSGMLHTYTANLRHLNLSKLRIKKKKIH